MICMLVSYKKIINYKHFSVAHIYTYVKLHSFLLPDRFQTSRSVGSLMTCQLRKSCSCGHSVWWKDTRICAVTTLPPAGGMASSSMLSFTDMSKYPPKMPGTTRKFFCGIILVRLADALLLFSLDQALLNHIIN